MPGILYFDTGNTVRNSTFAVEVRCKLFKYCSNFAHNQKRFNKLDRYIRLNNLGRWQRPCNSCPAGKSISYGLQRRRGKERHPRQMVE